MSLRISVLEIKLFFSLTDMQGNIKALKYALNHELVYRDSAALLHKVGKPVPPYQKVMQCSVRTKFVLHILKIHYHAVHLLFREEVIKYMLMLLKHFLLDLLDTCKSFHLNDSIFKIIH